MFRNFDFSHLIPHFSSEQKKELELYYAFSKEFEKDMQEVTRKEFEEHPVIGPIVKSMTREMQEANNKESDRLLNEAIFKDKWEPYIRHLMMQGVQFANMGLDFRTWYEVLAIVRKYYVPVLNDMTRKDPGKVSMIRNGMIHLFDYAMGVIGESFIHEKNRKIEEQNTKLEGMIKELESFAYIISHDLKTPLRGIASLADWLEQDYKDKLDETGREYIDLMKNRVLRLESLIDGVLAYSRAGRADAVREKIDFNVLVKEAIDANAVSENIDIKIDNTLPTSTGVRTALFQVFSNLIGNAIKHNDKEKIKINVGCTDENGDWKFYVRDNGPGIPKEFQDKVFKIFQTLKTKDETNSTGIGLSVVKKAIENHAGRVWIESEPGKGSTFFFSIRKQ